MRSFHISNSLFMSLSIRFASIEMNVEDILGEASQNYIVRSQNRGIPGKETINLSHTQIHIFWQFKCIKSSIPQLLNNHLDLLHTPGVLVCNQMYSIHLFIRLFKWIFPLWNEFLFCPLQPKTNNNSKKNKGKVLLLSSSSSQFDSKKMQ